MNCESVRGHLLVADLPVRDPADVREHLAGCVSCAALADLLTSSESILSAGLESARPTRSAATVATMAWSRARERSRRLRLFAVVGATVVAAAALSARYLLPEIRRLTAPPPPAVTQTFSLSCLSGAQAATLLRPYLPIPQNPRWQAEAFDVWPAGDGIRAVTVRAPQDLIDRVPVLLTRLESDPGADCRR